MLFRFERRAGLKSLLDSPKPFCNGSSFCSKLWRKCLEIFTTSPSSLNTSIRLLYILSFSRSGIIPGECFLNLLTNVKFSWYSSGEKFLESPKLPKEEVGNNWLGDTIDRLWMQISLLFLKHRKYSCFCESSFLKSSIFSPPNLSHLKIIGGIL